MGRDAHFLLDHGSYRTVDFVKHECAQFAQQLADSSARIEHIDATRELIARMREAKHSGEQA